MRTMTVAAESPHARRDARSRPHYAHAHATSLCSEDAFTSRGATASKKRRCHGPIIFAARPFRFAIRPASATFCSVAAASLASFRSAAPTYYVATDGHRHYGGGAVSISEMLCSLVEMPLAATGDYAGSRRRARPRSGHMPGRRRSFSSVRVPANLLVHDSAYAIDLLVIDLSDARRASSHPPISARPR